MTKYEKLSLILSASAVIMSSALAVWQVFESRSVPDSLAAEYRYYRHPEGVSLEISLTNLGKEKVYVTDLQSGYVKDKYFTARGIGGEYDYIEKPFEPGEQRRFIWKTIDPKSFESERARLNDGFFIRLITSRGQQITLSGFSDRFKETIAR